MRGIAAQKLPPSSLAAISIYGGIQPGKPWRAGRPRPVKKGPGHKARPPAGRQFLFICGISLGTHRRMDQQNKALKKFAPAYRVHTYSKRNKATTRLSHTSSITDFHIKAMFARKKTAGYQIVKEKRAAMAGPLLQWRSLHNIETYRW